MRAKELKELLEHTNDDAEVRLVYVIARNIAPLSFSIDGGAMIMDEDFACNHVVYLKVGNLLGNFPYHIRIMPTFEKKEQK